MDNEENGLVSLCRVNKPDKNNKIWVLPLADIVNGSLVDPVKRDWLFLNDGPSTPDAVGFWEWDNTRESFQYRACYREDIASIEILTLLGAENENDIINKLKTGVQIPNYIHENMRILFGAWNNGILQCVSCALNDFSPSPKPGLFKIREDRYALLYYELHNSDIFTTSLLCLPGSNTRRKIYKHVSLGESPRTIYLYQPQELIKKSILNCFGWSTFKSKGILKRDWRKLKDAMEEIPVDEPFYEKISDRCGIGRDEAKQQVEDFLKSVESYIDANDIETNIILQIAERHPDYRERCDKLVSEKWHKEHETEIESARRELQEIREQTGKEKESAEREKEKFRSEIASAKAELENLRSEIEYHKALGDGALQAVREKIAAARGDMSHFIAEFSPLLGGITPAEGAASPTRPRWKFTMGKPFLGRQEECTTWDDTILLLENNLQQVGVAKQWLTLLAGFLYAAWFHKTDILLAGPNSKQIVDALAVSVTGKSAGILACTGDVDMEAVLRAEESGDSIIAVENPFHPEWTAHIPYYEHDRGTARQMLIWTHPFAEDLLIEPRGLYNHVLPVLNEFFTEPCSSAPLFTAAKTTETFEALDRESETPEQFRLLDKISAGRFLSENFRRVLTTAASIPPKNAADYEYLFAVAPILYLTGKKDTLRDMVEDKKSSLSDAARHEIQRFISDE